MSEELEKILQQRYGDDAKIEGDQLFVADNAVSRFADLVIAFHPALYLFDEDPVHGEAKFRRNIQVALEPHLLKRALHYFTDEY